LNDVSGTIIGETIGYALTAADLAIFAGYVLWCLRLLAMAIVLSRVP
jgi:hypothetical protein